MNERLRRVLVQPRLLRRGKVVGSLLGIHAKTAGSNDIVAADRVRGQMTSTLR